VQKEGRKKPEEGEREGRARIKVKKGKREKKRYPVL